MFRNDEQRGEVCFILCAWVRGSPWVWTSTGYRPEGKAPTGLSTGEAKMLRFAMALWRGGDLPVWQGFDSRRLGSIAAVLVAMTHGPDAVDAWCTRQGGSHGSQRSDSRTPARRDEDIRRTARGT